MILGAAVLGITAVACNKETTSPNTPNNQADAGTFEVRMTDAPGDYEALQVEIVKVEAYAENKGWVALNNQAQSVSVLELTNGAETQLALKSDIDAGVYSRLKLTFGSNNSLMASADANIQVSSGGDTIGASVAYELAFQGNKEVIIEIDEQISSETGAVVLLDFNVMQSIKEEADELVIQPVITEIEDAQTGVRGKIEGSANAAILLTNGSDSLSTFTNANGEFLLRSMDEGMYDLIVIPETDQDPSNDEVIIEGVFISQGEITNAGTIEL